MSLKPIATLLKKPASLQQRDSSIKNAFGDTKRTDRLQQNVFYRTRFSDYQSEKVFVTVSFY